MKQLGLLLLLSPLLLAAIVAFAPKYSADVNNPHFTFATWQGKNAVKLCIGRMNNCRVMYKRGMKGHRPLWIACPIAAGIYTFCKPKTDYVLPTMPPDVADQARMK